MASFTARNRSGRGKQLCRVDLIEFVAVIAEFAMHLDGLSFGQDSLDFLYT